MPTKKYIRFIDSSYNTLFHLQDGGRIRITRPNGEQIERVCRFLDECHTQVGNNVYHICEFAERMEGIGAKYTPLDYIRELEFYRKFYFTKDSTAKGPPYFIIDEISAHGFAFAPKGAAKGRKYCIFEILQIGPNRRQIGNVILWGSSLRDIHPREWGFDMEKIRAVTQKPKTKNGPDR